MAPAADAAPAAPAQLACDIRAAAPALNALAPATIFAPFEFGPTLPKDVSPDPANDWHATDFLDLAKQLKTR